jgi:hypothetical protein
VSDYLKRLLADDALRLEHEIDRVELAVFLFPKLVTHNLIKLTDVGKHENFPDLDLTITEGFVEIGYRLLIGLRRRATARVGHLDLLLRSMVRATRSATTGSPVSCKRITAPLSSIQCFSRTTTKSNAAWHLAHRAAYTFA